jgi:hypothetical protein
MRYILILLLLLTSCIEIIEDIKLNKDGSGTFKYTINLSSSKVKVSSILALDSLNGYKVPKINDIKLKVQMFKKTLKEQKGISNIIITEDYTNYIIKLQCDFTNIELLETALKESFNKFDESKNYDYDWISFTNKKLQRSTPIFGLGDIQKYGSQDIENLKKGSYTSITRFDSQIDTFENINSVRSKSNMALMLRVTPNLLMEDQTILNNKIFLK